MSLDQQDLINELKIIKNKLIDRQQTRIKQILPLLLPTHPTEIGIYGSFAREKYTATSDLDMYALYEVLPDKTLKGELYESAHMLGIDLLICTPTQLYETDSTFCKNILQDQKIIWKKGDNL